MTNSSDMPKKTTATKKAGAKPPVKNTGSDTPSTKKAAAKKAAPKKAPAKKAAAKETAPKATANAAAPKKAVAKKAAPKKAAAKKAATKKASPARKPSASTSVRTISGDERRGLIAQAAYLRAERRQFAGGGEAEDWLAAEAEVDARLKKDGIEVAD